MRWRRGSTRAFVVLDEPEARRLADGAFERRARGARARSGPGGVELIAAYGPGACAAAILDVYGELRSRGQTEPALPPLPPAPDLEAARGELVAGRRGAR